MTIDTEADNQWDHGRPLETKNVSRWPVFQGLCRRCGIAPTYLVTSEIAADGGARELLADWVASGEAEVGAHLHPWTTPPFRDLPGYRENDLYHAFATQLDAQLLRDKLDRLTSDVADAVGRGPTSFRAGRYGFGLVCARLLRELGYLVDSSVTPYTSWAKSQGVPGMAGPDFSHHTPSAFVISGTGEPGLVELPMTVIVVYLLLRRYPLLLRAYQTTPARATRRLLLSRWLRRQPIWLVPFPNLSLDDLVAAWDAAERQGLGAAVMAFHSSELVPGGSPYRPDERSVAALLECLEGFFEHARARGGRFLTLTAAARELSAQSRLPVRAL